MTGHEVLQANHALREWAASLRQWSRSARNSAHAERRRSQRERPLGTGSVSPSSRRDGGPASPAGRGRAEIALPGLGEVRVVDLLALLVEQHSLSPAQARCALSVGMLGAGYPSGHPRVAAVDAFDVMEHAVQHRS